MSKEAIQCIIGKAILDADFRQRLFADPEKALMGFKLTVAEKKRLMRVDSETLEYMAKALGALEPVSRRGKRRISG